MSVTQRVIMRGVGILALLFVTGCTNYHISDVTAAGGPNSQLLYLPWWNTGEVLPAYLQDRKETAAFDLQPSMRVVVRTVPIRAHNDNSLIVAPSSFEWILPEPAVNDEVPKYAREDFFFLSWLLAMGRTDRNDTGDRDGDFDGLGKHVFDTIGDGGVFSDAYATAAIGQWVNPSYWRDRRDDDNNGVMPKARMRIQSYHPDRLKKEGGVYTGFKAGLMRNRLCSAHKLDFINPGQNTISKATSRSLVMSVKGRNQGGNSVTRDLEVLDGSNWFYNGNLATVSRKTNEDTTNRLWMVNPNTSLFIARADLSVNIAIRIADESTSRYVPACLSVADMERVLGREIVGVRRSADHLKGLTIDGKPTARVLEDIVSGGKDYGYASFYFGGRHSLAYKTFGADFVVSVDPSQKSQWVIGHRDVILLGSKRRAPTDRPGAY